MSISGPMDVVHNAHVGPNEPIDDQALQKLLNDTLGKQVRIFFLLFVLSCILAFSFCRKVQFLLRAPFALDLSLGRNWKRGRLYFQLCATLNLEVKMEEER